MRVCCAKTRVMKKKKLATVSLWKMNSQLQFVWRFRDYKEKGANRKKKNKKRTCDIWWYFETDRMAKAQPMVASQELWCWSAFGKWHCMVKWAVRFLVILAITWPGYDCLCVCVCVPVVLQPGRVVTLLPAAASVSMLFLKVLFEWAFFHHLHAVISALRCPLMLETCIKNVLQCMPECM